MISYLLQLFTHQTAMPSTAAQMGQPSLAVPLTTHPCCPGLPLEEQGRPKPPLAGCAGLSTFRGLQTFHFSRSPRTTWWEWLDQQAVSPPVMLLLETWEAITLQRPLASAYKRQPRCCLGPPAAFFKKASSFVLSLINLRQLLKVNDLASGDAQITGAETLLPASMGHRSVTFIYWINPPVSSRRTTAKCPLIVGWCADETNLQRDCKPLFLHLLLLFLWD